MTELDIQEYGQGVPVVLVHGSLNTAEEEWEAQLPLADEGFRLVVPNRRGYGDSPGARGEDFAQDGEDVAELLGDGAHLVGHSYGGLAAMVAAERRPDALLSLALIEPPAFGLRPDHPAIAPFLHDLRDLWAKTELSDREFLEAFLRLMGEAPEEMPGEMLAGLTERVPVLRHGAAAWDANFRLDRISAGRFPTLVVSGDHHEAFNAVCEELGRRLGAHTTAIPGAGHEVQTLGEPCNRALEELWRSV